MRNLKLNQNANLWFRKARGFKLVYQLLVNEWNSKHESSETQKLILIIEPAKHILFTCIELYLRAYLLTKAISWQDSKGIMQKKGPHNLSALLQKCKEFEYKFNDKIFIFIDKMAGSTQNYGGSRYPESGGSISGDDLKLLEDLDTIVGSSIDSSFQ